MIEALMYFGIGFLLAALSVLVVTPLVHGRAVRLTARRVKATIPQSFAEVVADKDLLRAEFAMSTRRLETNVEQLRTKSANQLAELGRKADAINHLKVEVGSLREQLRVTEEEFAVKTSATRDTQRRLFEKDAELAKPMSELDKRSSIVDAQTVEIIALKTRIEALKEQLTAADSELKAEGDVIPLMPMAPMDSSQSPSSNDQHHEGDVIPLMPKVPMDSSQSPSSNDQHHEGDVINLMPKVPMDSSQSPPPKPHEGDATPLAPKVRPTARNVPMDSQSPLPNLQHHEGNVTPLAPKVRPTAEKTQSSGSARDPHAGRDASELRAVEPSIRVFPRPSGFKNDPFASGRLSIGRRTFRTLARFSIAALIGVGGSSAWQSHGGEAMEKIRAWAPSLGWLSSVLTTKSPPVPTPAPAATSPELMQQLGAMPRDLASMRRSVEQLTEKQEQMARNIATLQPTEQDIKKRTSSPHLRRRAKLTPWPETRPTTIEGWTLRGITNGTAVLEGPNGVWRAMRGDIVPGVGRVESMVRWGSRLVVATSRGLISTP